MKWRREKCSEEWNNCLFFQEKQKMPQVRSLRAKGEKYAKSFWEAIQNRNQRKRQKLKLLITLFWSRNSESQCINEGREANAWTSVWSSNDRMYAKSHDVQGISCCFELHYIALLFLVIIYSCIFTAHVYYIKQKRNNNKTGSRIDKFTACLLPSPVQLKKRVFPVTCSMCPKLLWMPIFTQNDSFSNNHSVWLFVRQIILILTSKSCDSVSHRIS